LELELHDFGFGVEVALVTGNTEVLAAGPVIELAGGTASEEDSEVSSGLLPSAGEEAPGFRTPDEKISFWAPGRRKSQSEDARRRGRTKICPAQLTISKSTNTVITGTRLKTQAFRTHIAFLSSRHEDVIPFQLVPIQHLFWTFDAFRGIVLAEDRGFR
jgi:hypothetical protein